MPAVARELTPGPTVAVVNRCSALEDAEVLRFTKAFQVQVDRDLAPIWDQPANLIFVGKNETPPKHVWQLLIEDHSPEADAAGFHLVTDDGYPLGHVYAKDAIEGQMSWTVTGSHEGCELLVDPRCDQVRFNQTSATAGVIYALEICDAVEDDQFGYGVSPGDGGPDVLLSAFMTRQWFQLGPHRAGTAYSYPVGIVNAPFELADGGYIGVFTFGKGWDQVFAKGPPGRRAIKKSTSRTMRRFHADA